MACGVPPPLRLALNCDPAQRRTVNTLLCRWAVSREPHSHLQGRGADPGSGGHGVVPRQNYCDALTAPLPPNPQGLVDNSEGYRSVDQCIIPIVIGGINTSESAPTGPCVAWSCRSRKGSLCWCHDTGPKPQDPRGYAVRHRPLLPCLVRL